MSVELLMGPDDFEAESDSRRALPASNKVEESMTERRGVLVIKDKTKVVPGSVFIEEAVSKH